MKNGPAFSLENEKTIFKGITKREYFAAIAMQGICSMELFAESDERTIAKMAVAQADALIAELGKEGG